MRKSLCLLLSGLLVAVQLPLSAASAQSLPDADPPVIELEIIASGVAGNAQVFTAQVVDDRELVDVVLYHRRAGRQPYVALPMQALGDTTFYSATVATEADDARAIEYYVQARDAGGNRTVEGFAFDPRVRNLSLPAAPIAAAPAAPSATAADDRPTFSVGGVPWWQIALGAVAVGALAAAAGGSGGGSGGDRADGTVPLTINLTEPR